MISSFIFLSSQNGPNNQVPFGGAKNALTLSAVHKAIKAGDEELAASLVNDKTYLKKMAHMPYGAAPLPCLYPLPPHG